MEETPQSTPSGVTETPQTSLDQTGDSGGTPASSEKRWNLRVRKPRQAVEQPEEEEEEQEGEEEEMEEEPVSDAEEEEEEEEEEEDEGEEEEEEVVKERPPRRSSAKGSAPAKKAEAPPPPNPRKRKAAAANTSGTMRAQPAAKRKATVAAVVANTSRGGGGGGGRTLKGKTLFDTVTSGKTSLKGVASDWVQRYEEDAESGMLELIQYFVLCCGCRAEITMDMYRGEIIDVIRSLTENFAEDSGDYPLIMTGPGQKKFKMLFGSFISHLMEQCQNSVVYDEYMLDTLIVWLVGFTDSQVRAFRHTCTVACVKLLSALIDIANNVNYILDNTQRQVEAERKRQLVKRTEAGQSQLEKLVSKRGALQRNKNELEDVMKGLFSSVFVHRYRDVRAEIRAACITELGYWLIHYSVKFLADNYLKYVGWMLFDKVGEVRLACLKVLEELYSSNDHAPHLELFTARFKERLLSMRLDVDEATAVTGITVLTHMLSLDLLEAEECMEVCELIFMEARAISHAAGQFAVKYLFSADFMDRARQKPVPAGKKKPSEGEIQLMELIRFFCEVKIHDHAHYFVESLWECCEVLRDWEAMSSLLLDEKSSFSLKDEEVAALIEVMTCAVRRAAGAPPPAGRARGKMIGNKEKRAMELAKEDMTTHLMALLPQLITKYGNDPENAMNLISIPQYFDLEIYAESRLQKHLEDLLGHLHQLTIKHVETTVLDECAQTFHYLLDPDFSLHSAVDVSFRRLVDELVENFKQQCTECPEQSLMEENDEEGFSLMLSIRRLVCYYKLRDLSGSKFSTELNHLQSLCVKGECSDKIVENVVCCLKLELMWDVQRLDKEATPSRDTLRAVRAKQMQLFKDCEKLVKFGQGCGQREAYVTLTDLLVVFARQLRQNQQLSGLVYQPQPSLQQTLQDFVMDHVMNSSDDDEMEPASDEEALQIAERLNDRRVLLAAFLKLSMFQVIETKMAAPIWGHFMSQYHNFGDLIRLNMNKIRETNPIGWYKTAISCLTELYLELKEEGLDSASEGWAELKELAKKFALSLGFDAMKVRQPLVGIHREGIMFAVARQEKPGRTVNHSKPPPNLDFLSILSEFSHRLLMVDRCGEKGVLPFLLRQLPEGQFKRIQDNKLPGWEPLIAYFKATQPNKGGVATTAGGRGRKRMSKGDGSIAKLPRVEAASPTGSDAGPEEGGAASESPPPPPEGGRRTRGRGQQRKAQISDA